MPTTSRAAPLGVLAQTSIIIPVGLGDTAWLTLLRDLTDAGVCAELFLIAAESEPDWLSDFVLHTGPRQDVRWITTTAGRARQMNRGAQVSTKPFLWFLHADSRVRIDALQALERALELQPQALHYFDLAFQEDGPRLVQLNGLGVRFRSRYLALPFGDQGLCMSRDTFQRLGGYDETVTYGEDHLLVWAAHRLRVPLRGVESFIATSARKYRARGWLRTTLLHAWRTWSQAIPQVFQFVRSRWR